MKKIHKIFLSVASALLLTPAYMHWGSGLFMFVALIPLLLVEEDHFSRRTNNKTLGLTWYPAITFFLFNLLTISWVRNAAWIGVVAALIINTTVMTTPFILFHYVKRNIGPRLGYIALICLWTGFEFLYLNGKVNFPWLIFGNAFANDVALIQWYEFTGALGGSVWILIVNVLLAKIAFMLKAGSGFQEMRGLASWTLAFLLIPVTYSLVRFFTYDEHHRPYEFIVLQPNIDPYMKFEDMPQDQQTYYLLSEAEKLLTKETDYVVGPETFINNTAWQTTLGQNSEILKIKELIQQYPNMKFIIGAMTMKRFMADDKNIPPNARELRDGSFYQTYNSAIQVDADGTLPLYHKSKLVAGVELMPSFLNAKPFRGLIVNLGGNTRTHGVQEERSSFVSPQDKLRVGPVICWESIFGEFVTEYITKADAEILVIITNDGWWGNTPGHRQHNAFARLRAIETRRSIARSANTGISCLIDQRGKELERIPYWERSAIKGTLNANDKITFYARYGDYAGRLGLFLGIAFVLYAFVMKRIRR